MRKTVQNIHVKIKILRTLKETYKLDCSVVDVNSQFDESISLHD